MLHKDRGQRQIIKTKQNLIFEIFKKRGVEIYWGKKINANDLKPADKNLPINFFTAVFIYL